MPCKDPAWRPPTPGEDPPHPEELVAGEAAQPHGCREAGTGQHQCSTGFQSTGCVLPPLHGTVPAPRPLSSPAASLGEMPAQGRSRGAVSMTAGSPCPAEHKPFIPHPSEPCSGSPAPGSAAPRLWDAQPSWQPAASAPGGGTRAGNPVRCFLSPALRHPREAIFDKSFAHLHICSAAAGQEKSLRAGPGAETSAESPGHIRCGLPPARTPPFFPHPGAGQAAPPPLWIFPSLLPVPGVSVSFHLSAHTDVETGKIFMQPKARFLREAASSSSARGGLRLSSAPPPQQPEPNCAGLGGGKAGKRPGRSEPAHGIKKWGHK